MRQIYKLLFLILLTCQSFSLGAETKNMLIVDTTYVINAQNRQVILWDVREHNEYLSGHIPNAINMGDIKTVLRQPHDENYIPLNRLKALFNQTGLDLSQEIIVYGNKASPVAYFGLLTLQYFGANKVRVYHGGIEQWQADNQAVSQSPNDIFPVDNVLKIQPQLTIDTAGVLNKVGNKNVQFVDVRTPAEYLGEDIRALRGGHIPGAINIPYEENWAVPQAIELADLDLKSEDDLQSLYQPLSPTAETIVYCQSGVRAAQTAVILKELGFKNVKVYESSWLGYGNTLSAPAENEIFVNIGELKGEIEALKEQVQQLEILLKSKK